MNENLGIKRRLRNKIRITIVLQIFLPNQSKKEAVNNNLQRDEAPATPLANTHIVDGDFFRREASDPRTESPINIHMIKWSKKESHSYSQRHTSIVHVVELFGVRKRGEFVRVRVRQHVENPENKNENLLQKTNKQQK